LILDWQPLGLVLAMVSLTLSPAMLRVLAPEIIKEVTDNSSDRTDRLVESISSSMGKLYIMTDRLRQDTMSPAAFCRDVPDDLGDSSYPIDLADLMGDVPLLSRGAQKRQVTRLREACRRQDCILDELNQRVRSLARQQSEARERLAELNTERDELLESRNVKQLDAKGQENVSHAEVSIDRWQAEPSKGSATAAKLRDQWQAAPQNAGSTVLPTQQSWPQLPQLPPTLQNLSSSNSSMAALNSTADAEGAGSASQPAGGTYKFVSRMEANGSYGPPSSRSPVVKQASPKIVSRRVHFNDQLMETPPQLYEPSTAPAPAPAAIAILKRSAFAIGAGSVTVPVSLRASPFSAVGGSAHLPVGTPGLLTPVRSFSPPARVAVASTPPQLQATQNATGISPVQQATSQSQRVGVMQAIDTLRREQMQTPYSMAPAAAQHLT